MQPKWVAFTGGASAKVDAPGGGRSGKALADYLALPVSQYSLLDEKLVERRAQVLCKEHSVGLSAEASAIRLSSV